MRLLEKMFIPVGEPTADNAVYALSLRPDVNHVIYQAHFPGSPVTPGVCIIKVIGEIIENHLMKTIELQEVKNLKFIVPVVPTQDKEIDVLFSQLEIVDGVIRARGTIEKGKTIYTKFSTLWKIKK